MGSGGGRVAQVEGWGLVLSASIPHRGPFVDSHLGGTLQPKRRRHVALATPGDGRTSLYGPQAVHDRHDRLVQSLPNQGLQADLVVGATFESRAAFAGVVKQVAAIADGARGTGVKPSSRFHSIVRGFTESLPAQQRSSPGGGYGLNSPLLEPLRNFGRSLGSVRHARRGSRGVGSELKNEGLEVKRVLGLVKRQVERVKDRVERNSGGQGSSVDCSLRARLGLGQGEAPGGNISPRAGEPRGPSIAILRALICVLPPEMYWFAATAEPVVVSGTDAPKVREFLLREVVPRRKCLGAFGRTSSTAT